MGRETSLEENRIFQEDSALKGYSEYPFCIVMEAGTQSLKHLIEHEQIAANDWVAIKNITRSLALALQHIHQKHLIHGDLKPLNVLHVGKEWKLIDLDASANVQNQEHVGLKHSSGYNPHEMLVLDEDGTPRMREGIDGVTAEAGKGLILAHYSQDMWALGCVLYYLCTTHSLFHVDTADNIVDPDEYLDLYNWETKFKGRKLSTISDKYAKHLVSMLLNKDPAMRPDATRVLDHPFISGRSVARLPGDKAMFDVFLSYRVSSDSDMVQRLYENLIEKGLKVWLDKHCLQPGKNWEEGFCDGLIKSAHFVPLLSRAAIRNDSNDRSNIEKLTADSPCDNVVLEWRLALELKQRGMIEGIFPVFVGEQGADGLYSKYVKRACNPPDIVVKSVEHKMHDHLEREGLGHPYKEEDTVASILNTIMSNQGANLDGDLYVSMESVSSSIKHMVDVSKQNSSHSQEEAATKVSVKFTRALLSTYRSQNMLLRRQASMAVDIERKPSEDEIITI